MSSEHQLATILFADIAGYTAMMQKNELQALELLNRFKEVLEEYTPKHQGRIIQYFGDGCLLAFGSSTNSVDCAIALQKAFTESQAVPVRIGMHLGEVIFRNENVFGDGVNIASRIESLGIPGSILLSKPIRDQIKNKSDFLLASLGTFDFKNVSEPMEVFALANPGFVVPKREEMHGKLKDIPKKSRDLKWIIAFTLVAVSTIAFWFHLGKNNNEKKSESTETISVRSIAVLPFDDYSPNKDQSWFTDGMTDALITELSKISSLNVRSRTSVMQYKGTKKTIPEIAKELGVDAIIEGSAIKAGDSVRITAQFINSKDKHIWANDYDEGLENVLRLHHIIAQAITKEINIVLTPTDLERFTPPPKVKPAAWEAYQRGKYASWSAATVEDLKKAIVFFQQAISIDSTFSMAYADLVSTYWYYPFLGEKSPQEAWQLAEGPNNIALRLDPQSAVAHINQFAYRYFIKWDWEGALQDLSKAESLDPNNLTVLEKLLSYNITTGKFNKAFEVCERIRQSDPSDSSYYLYSLALTQFHTRDFDGALRTTEKGLKLYKENNGATISLMEIRSWTLSVTGKHEEAVKYCRKILTMLNGSSTMDHELAGWIFARAGLKSEALKEITILKKSNYCDPVGLGLIYLGLGDKEKAIQYFQEAFNEHSMWLPYLKRAPPFDPLRGDPQFEKLIQDLKFP